MIEYLKVPFGYDADILPSRKHKYTRQARLRSEILVELQHFSRSEFLEVAELPVVQYISGWDVSVEGDRCLLWRGGRLFAPLRVSGVSADLKGAIAALAEPELSDDGPSENSPFSYAEMYDYPLATDGAWQFWHTPLMAPSFGSHRISQGWPHATMVGSDLRDRELDAADRLAGAFAIVDGVVYMQRPEPVWRLRHVGRRFYRLVVETIPWAIDAPNCFRLDKRRDALAWAAHRRIRIIPQDVGEPARIFLPEKLTRCDALEVAAAALAIWPRLRDEVDPDRGALYGRGGDAETLDDLHEAGGKLDHAQARVLMDALQRLMDVANNPPQWRTLRAAQARWRIEGPCREGDLFADADSGFSDEDLAALASL